MSQDTHSKGLWAFDLVKWTVIGSFILFGCLLLLFGTGEEGLRHLIRWSARMSFTLYCIAFSVSALHLIFKNSFTWWLRMNRKYFGISFAIVHLIHLVFIVILQLAFHPVFELARTSSLVGGAIAYFFVVTMLMTSFETFSSYLSPFFWKILHTAGGYWIGMIYFSSYFKRADTEPIHWIPVAILVLIVLIRILKFSRSRASVRATGLFSLLIFLPFMVFSQSSESASETEGDLLIKNAWIIDGMGSEKYMGSVLVNDGRISAIEVGGLSRLKGNITIDAQGKVISPGFIDIHAHGDPIVTPVFENFLAMGVTTIALGMDGSSVTSEDFGSWLDKVDMARPGVNIVPFIGHGTLRRECGIGSSTEVSQHQLKDLNSLITRAFENGCWGVSMGLEYMPGFYAGSEELKTIAKTVGSYEGLITSHIRNEDNDQIENSLDEMILLSEFCNINISHIKVVYGKGEKRAADLLSKIEQANQFGYKVTADLYPYTASYTGIGIVFPTWAKNPKKYAEIKSERGDELLDFLRKKITQRNGPGATLFGTGPYKGKTLQNLVEEYDRPYEVILRDIIGPYGASAAYFIMDEELQNALMTHKSVMIGSDGSPTMHHPRGYGTFTKVIQENVSDGSMSIEEAIYKMTGMPAETIGLKDRGKLKIGHVADLIIFDPDEVRNNASFESPHQLSSGIEFVIIDGHIVRSNEQLTLRKGRVLRKLNR